MVGFKAEPRCHLLSVASGRPAPLQGAQLQPLAERLWPTSLVRSLPGKLVEEREGSPLEGLHGPTRHGDVTGFPRVYHGVIHAAGTGVPVITEAGPALRVGTGHQAPLGTVSDSRVLLAATAPVVQDLEVQQLLRVAEGRVVQ